jgi:hypothetical protein
MGQWLKEVVARFIQQVVLRILPDLTHSTTDSILVIQVHRTSYYDVCSISAIDYICLDIIPNI